MQVFYLIVVSKPLIYLILSTFFVASRGRLQIMDKLFNFLWLLLGAAIFLGCVYGFSFAFDAGQSFGPYTDPSSVEFWTSSGLSLFGLCFLVVWGVLLEKKRIILSTLCAAIALVCAGYFQPSIPYALDTDFGPHPLLFWSNIVKIIVAWIVALVAVGVFAKYTVDSLKDMLQSARDWWQQRRAEG